jgi:hypothetical protein
VRVISGFHRGLNKTVALLGLYEAYSTSYRRFGTNYRPHLQGSSNPKRWDRKVVPRRRLLTANLRGVKYQKNEYLIFLCTFPELEADPVDNFLQAGTSLVYNKVTTILYDA